MILVSGAVVCTLRKTRPNLFQNMEKKKGEIRHVLGFHFESETHETE